MIERWNTRVKSISCVQNSLCLSLFLLIFFRYTSVSLSFSFFSLSPSFLFRSFFYRERRDRCQPVAANEWRAAAALMNRLWAARHTAIMVPTADSWNCCARTSWQINRRPRRIDRGGGKGERKKGTDIGGELVFRASPEARSVIKTGQSIVFQS